MSSGCGDVLSLEDLKTAKKHQTFEAEVITGRAGGVPGGVEIDTATNPVTGQVQKTMPAILRDIGFNPAPFDFMTGGTLTVADRDAVVYNPADNNWYSWSGTLPHVVTSGTNPLADSNWEPRTDQLLRQELAARDGYKCIGQCPDIATLRTTEPTSTGQKILVMSYRSGWAAETGAPVGGGEFYYDKNDTTSADDDIFVFVTPNGARWKRGSSGKKIKLEWKGIRSGDDATAALTSIGSYLKSRAKSAGTVRKLPRLEVSAGEYYLSDTIILSSACRIKSVGAVEFRTISTWDMTVTKPIFSIENDSDIPNLPSPEKSWSPMDPWLNGDDGYISIIGPGRNILNKCRGLSVGNTVTGMTAIRGPVFRGVEIRNCGDGLHLRTRNTYLLSFQNFNIWDCTTCLTIPTQTAEDSGEKVNFSHGIFGAAIQNNVYCAMATSLFYHDVSFDYALGDAIVLAGESQYGLHSFSQCHSENMGGYFINATTGSRVRINIEGNLNPSQPGTKTASNSQSPSRVMIYLANGGHVTFNGLSVMQAYRPLTHENFLVAVGSTTAAANTTVSVNGLTSGDDAYTPCPIKSAVMNPSWDISGETVGNTITNLTTYTTTSLIPALESGSTGWSSGQTATVVDLGDGTKALKISNPNSGNYAFLQGKEYVPVSPGKAYSMYFSIQKLVATGALNWSVGYYWYNSDKTLLKTDVKLSGALGTVYADTTLPGYLSDNTSNGNRKLSTTMGRGVAPAGAAYCRPFIRLTDFVGNVNIINYPMWEAK